MTEAEIFDGLKKMCLEDLEEVPEGDIVDISFCVFMTATRPDGTALTATSSFSARPTSFTFSQWPDRMTT